jgi:hypothetical protein
MPKSADVRWRRIGTLTLAVVAAMTLAACGATQSGQKSTSTASTATMPPTTSTAAATTTTLAPTDATALPGYLAVATNQVLFIEFTRSGDEISGTVQFAYLSSDGSQIETSNGPIDGKISVSSVAINDENSVITTSGRVSGTFQGSNLVLAFPQQNGQLAPVSFSPASVADYDNALSTLQNEANRTAAAQQAAAAAARLRLEQAVAATSDGLTNACVAAGGSVVPEGGGSAFPSSCTVDGVSDQVYGGAAPQASYAEPPATIETDAQGCRGNGGSWGYEPGDGYYTGQTDWDCTVDGFQDQVISFSSGSYDVPISSVRAVAALMNECVNNAHGDFGLDLNKPGGAGGTIESASPYSCGWRPNGSGGVLNPVYDDVVLSPVPHYASPLTQSG